MNKYILCWLLVAFGAALAILSSISIWFIEAPSAFPMTGLGTAIMALGVMLMPDPPHGPNCGATCCRGNL